MKKYFVLLLAAISLLIPGVAKAIQPKGGDYEGEATALSGTVRKSVRFHYGGGIIVDLFIGGKRAGVYRHIASGDDHHFTFHVTNSDSDRYVGHGRWHATEESAGDFREYKPGSGEINLYYTWHARWKRK